MSERPTHQHSEKLRVAVRTTYAEVACDPTGRFPYPVGRQGALGLGYERTWLERIPASVLNRFVGVGNPFAVERPAVGERVLDLGCGCGFDAFVAAQLVGETGRVVGVDLTPEMVAIAQGV